jgi:hypothetical protein
MENVSEWQNPFVDVFKKYSTFEAPKAFKGSVTTIHVLQPSARIRSSPEKPSRSQAQSSPITLSPSQIPQARSRPATSSADTYLYVKLALH